MTSESSQMYLLLKLLQVLTAIKNFRTTKGFDTATVTDIIILNAAMKEHVIKTRSLTRIKHMNTEY